MAMYGSRGLLETLGVIGINQFTIFPGKKRRLERKDWKGKVT